MALPFLVNIPFLFHNLFLFQKDFFKKTVRLGALSWDREKWQKIARFTAEPWELEGLTLVPSTSWWNLRNTIIRMGGFHIALNYLALLGKKNARAGLADLLIESGVCVAGITSVLMLGKCTTGGFVPTSSAWKHYLGFCGRRSWNGCRSKTMAWTTGQSTLLSTEVVIAEPHWKPKNSQKMAGWIFYLV